MTGGGGTAGLTREGSQLAEGDWKPHITWATCNKQSLGNRTQKMQVLCSNLQRPELVWHLTFTWHWPFAWHSLAFEWLSYQLMGLFLRCLERGFGFISLHRQTSPISLATHVSQVHFILRKTLQPEYIDRHSTDC